ncbi:IS4 family transposase [Streptomyces malaysiensis]|uniref:IS4 family transposase n=1 Tax=Streptomyces malaysiensis TaxID=92644 RepID=UPI00371A4DB3
MQEQSVITREIAVAAGVFAPGHLGELTQVVDFALVDAVLEETGTVQKRVRLLPSRVVVYFVLALALFERCSYRAVWGKLVASLDALALVRPCTSALCRARRRVGAAPFQALFETLAGPVAGPHTPGAFWRGLRTVAIDGTSFHLPDSEPIAARHTKRKRKGEDVEFGYPLLRLLVLIECGTRAVLAAAFGPETTGETTYAEQMLDRLARGMLVLLDTGFDGYPLPAPTPLHRSGVPVPVRRPSHPADHQAAAGRLLPVDLRHGKAAGADRRSMDHRDLPGRHGPPRAVAPGHQPHRPHPLPRP